MLTVRFTLALATPVILVAAGTFGYHWIEGWTLFDAFYMSVITLTTVGFGEVHPLSPAGRAYTAVLLLIGVFTLFYTATEVVRAIISGELVTFLGRQRRERSLSDLSHHYIICGYGRMGRFIAREFAAMHLAFVVVERNPEALAGFRVGDAIALPGDATSDDVLRRAGVERARGLIVALPSDADNLYVTMSARQLNEKLFIIARAEEEPAEQKLLRAGANRVVSPYVLAGHKIAQAVLRPSVVDFIDLATQSAHLELQIEEMKIGPSSSLAGLKLRESPLRRELGLVVLAIKKQGGVLVANPAAETMFGAGDTVIALGPREELDRVAALARG